MQPRLVADEADVAVVLGAAEDHRVLGRVLTEVVHGHRHQAGVLGLEDVEVAQVGGPAAHEEPAVAADPQIVRCVGTEREGVNVGVGRVADEPRLRLRGATGRIDVAAVDGADEDVRAGHARLGGLDPAATDVDAVGVVGRHRQREVVVALGPHVVGGDAEDLPPQERGAAAVVAEHQAGLRRRVHHVRVGRLHRERDATAVERQRLARAVPGATVIRRRVGVAGVGGSPGDRDVAVVADRHAGAVNREALLPAVADRERHDDLVGVPGLDPRVALMVVGGGAQRVERGPAVVGAVREEALLVVEGERDERAAAGPGVGGLRPRAPGAQVGCEAVERERAVVLPAQEAGAAAERDGGEAEVGVPRLGPHLRDVEVGAPQHQLAGAGAALVAEERGLTVEDDRYHRGDVGGPRLGRGPGVGGHRAQALEHGLAVGGGEHGVGIAGQHDQHHGQVRGPRAVGDRRRHAVAADAVEVEVAVAGGVAQEPGLAVDHHRRQRGVGLGQRGGAAPRGARRGETVGAPVVRVRGAVRRVVLDEVRRRR